jgi:hypothetical protein
MIAWRTRGAGRRAAELIRLLGFPQALVIAPRWLVQRKFLVLARDLTAGLPAPPHDPMVSRTLGPADLTALRDLDPAVSVDEIRRRWREGQRAEGGWDGDRLVYVRWESRAPTYLPYLGCRLCPRPTDLLVVDEFTHPAARGRGLSTVSSLRSLHAARDAGCRRSVALVAWWNRPALRVTRDQMGRHLVGTVGCWTLGPLRRYFATGEVRLDADGVSMHEGDVIRDVDAIPRA